MCNKLNGNDDLFTSVDDGTAEAGLDLFVAKTQIRRKIAKCYRAKTLDFSHRRNVGKGCLRMPVEKILLAVGNYFRRPRRSNTWQPRQGCP